MSDEPTLKLFEQTGAYLRGHFQLTSGLHSAEYLQSAMVLQNPAYAGSLGSQLASIVAQYAAGGCDVVVSPALGGVIIGHEVARTLGSRFVFTERDASGKMTLRRGFNIQPGEEAIVIEDVMTTGGSTRDVIDVLRAAGAIVLAAGCIIDRSGGAAELGVPYKTLATLSPATYQAAECPMCRAGEPLSKPGSRPGG